MTWNPTFREVKESSVKRSYNLPSIFRSLKKPAESLKTSWRPEESVVILFWILKNWTRNWGFFDFGKFQNSEPQVIKLALGGYHFFCILMIPTESGYHKAVEKLAWSSLNKIIFFSKTRAGYQIIYIYNLNIKIGEQVILTSLLWFFKNKKDHCQNELRREVGKCLVSHYFRPSPCTTCFVLLVMSFGPRLLDLLSATGDEFWS